MELATLRSRQWLSMHYFGDCQFGQIISVNQPPESQLTSTVPDYLSTLERCLALALVKLAALARLRCDFILETSRHLKLAVTHILAVSLETRSSTHWHYS